VSEVYAGRRVRKGVGDPSDTFIMQNIRKDIEQDISIVFSLQ